MKKLFWILSLCGAIFLASCQAQANVAPTEPAPAEAIAEAETETAPTDTAIASTSSEEADPQPTNTSPPPTPTQPLPPTPEPPATPTAVPTATPPDVPELVWLPYASGNFGEPVLMAENDKLGQQAMPVPVEIFFSYEAGWLAYGSKFWEASASQDSITDLHIYNFANGVDQLWADGIGRAALSPATTIAGQPEVAVAIDNGQGFDLVVLLGPDNAVPLVEDIDPYFSWSPDSSQIAYLKNGELFITSEASNSGNPSIASGLYQNSQWIGDAPLWLGDSGYLLVAETPFVIMAADGSETIVPLADDGSVLEGQRPFTMLYSSTHNQLIAESEGFLGFNVTVYQLGDDFRTAVPINQIDDAQLAGWYEADQSVVIVSGGEPTILPLTPQE